MLEHGYDDVINVEGGTKAFLDAGLNVVLGKKTVALDRQVRIVTGSLVVIGAALSFVHPLFALLAAMMGAGLVYSGVTDTCSMGMMLSKMPWNQVKEEKQGAACASSKDACCGG